MAESAEELGLEQKCIEPGHWLIEGYSVVARKRRGLTLCWHIMNAPEGCPRIFRTLADVRKWIWEHR